MGAAANSPQTFVGCGFHFSPFFKASAVLFEFILHVSHPVGCLGHRPSEWGLSLLVRISNSLVCSLGSETHVLSVGVIPGVETQLIGLIFAKLLSLHHLPATFHLPEASCFGAPTRKLGLLFPCSFPQQYLHPQPRGGKTGEEKSKGYSTPLQDQLERQAHLPLSFSSLKSPSSITNTTLSPPCNDYLGTGAQESKGISQKR